MQSPRKLRQTRVIVEPPEGYDRRVGAGRRALLKAIGVGLGLAALPMRGGLARIISGLVTDYALPAADMVGYAAAFAAFHEREAVAGDWRRPDLPLHVMETACLEATGAERLAAGAGTLLVDDGLRWIARYYAAQLAMGMVLEHQDAGGRHAADRVGILHRRLVGACAENLYANNLFDDGRPAAAGRLALDNLMQSQGHRRNLLDPRWTHAGYGAAQGPDGVVVVQLFTEQVALLADDLPLVATAAAAVPPGALRPQSGGFEGVAFVPLDRQPQARDFQRADRIKLPAAPGRYRSFFAQSQPGTGTTARYTIHPGPMLLVQPA